MNDFTQLSSMSSVIDQLRKILDAATTSRFKPAESAKYRATLTKLEGQFLCACHSSASEEKQTTESTIATPVTSSVLTESKVTPTIVSTGTMTMAASPDLLASQIGLPDVFMAQEGETRAVKTSKVRRVSE